MAILRNGLLGASLKRRGFRVPGRLGGKEQSPRPTAHSTKAEEKDALLVVLQTLLTAPTVYTFRVLASHMNSRPRVAVLGIATLTLHAPEATELDGMRPSQQASKS